jgi:membrane-bound lytic murein transglycosylase D
MLWLSIPVLMAQETRTEFEEGLQQMNSSIQVIYNPEVQQKINAYLNDPAKTKAILSRSLNQIPEIEGYLLAADLPAELAFVPMALSGFDNKRVSEIGGSGYWQMRYSVAKYYDLHISGYVDERRSASLSTQAAVNYLKDLYLEYGNWLIVIAALNQEPFEIKRAIRISGKEKPTIDDVYPHLSFNQREQVCGFIAAQYIYHFRGKYGFKVQAEKNPDVVEVPITDWLPLSKLSAALSVGLDTLKDLNPIYKKAIIPKSTRKYNAAIPATSAERFHELGDSVYRFGEKPVVNAEVIPEGQPLPDNAILVDQVKPKVVKPSTSSSTPSGKVKIYYTVRRGDVLGRIADYYDVGVSSIKRWNGLRSDRINVGQRLAIYVPSSRSSYYKKINTMSAAEKARIAAKD